MDGFSPLNFVYIICSLCHNNSHPLNLLCVGKMSFLHGRTWAVSRTRKCTLQRAEDIRRYRIHGAWSHAHLRNPFSVSDHVGEGQVWLCIYAPHGRWLLLMFGQTQVRAVPQTEKNAGVGIISLYFQGHYLRRRGMDLVFCRRHRAFPLTRSSWRFMSSTQRSANCSLA